MKFVMVTINPFPVAGVPDHIVSPRGSKLVILKSRLLDAQGGFDGTT